MLARITGTSSPVGRILDGTFDAILERLQMRLDEEGRIDWDLWMVDGSSIRAHAVAAGGGKKGDLRSPETMLASASASRRSSWARFGCSRAP